MNSLISAESASLPPSLRTLFYRQNNYAMAMETKVACRFLEHLLFTTPEMADHPRYWPRSKVEDFGRIQLIEKIARLKTLTI
jgi:hypothetical protein